MPTAAPNARYDIPWKLALTHAIYDFLDFFFPDIGTEVDRKKRPRFRDKELVAAGYGAAPDVMVADKLVEVFLRDGSAKWVLIHIEVQAQRDTALTRRVFDYNYRISKEYGRPVASLVILADEDNNWRPDSFQEQSFGVTTTFFFRTAKLLDYAADMDALAASHNPFAWLISAHLRTQQAHHDADKLYTAKWLMTRALFQHGWRRKRIIVLFTVINWMMALPALQEECYLQEVLQLREERAMELLNQWEQMCVDRGLKKGLEQGMEQGLEQGLEQGRKEGAVALLAKQLTRRFGPLPQAVQRKLAKASLVQVEGWSEVMLEATSLKQVFK